MATWGFVNKNTGQIIVCHDANSAENLKQLIDNQELQNEWQLQFQSSQEATEPAKAPSLPKPFRKDQIQGGSSRLPLIEYEPTRTFVEASPATDRRIKPREVSAKEAAPDPKDRRKFPRYFTEYRVIAVLGNISFRSHTADVSLGGIRLKHAIPKQLSGKICQIVIGHPSLKENLMISGKVLEGDAGIFRIEFKDADPKQIKLLDQWLKRTSDATSRQSA